MIEYQSGVYQSGSVSKISKIRGRAIKQSGSKLESLKLGTRYQTRNQEASDWREIMIGEQIIGERAPKIFNGTLFFVHL